MWVRRVSLTPGWQPGNQSPSWNHQTLRDQLVKRGDCPAAFRAGAASPSAWVEFWSPPLKKDVKGLECTLRTTTKLLKELEGKFYEEGLRACPLWRKGDWGLTLLFSTASCREEGTSRERFCLTQNLLKSILQKQLKSKGKYLPMNWNQIVHQMLLFGLLSTGWVPLHMM